MSSFGLAAQEYKSKILKTNITEVTVFIQGAQLQRTGKIQIPAGRTALRVKSLSPYIDEKSIQVEAEGEFTVVSISPRLNYLEQLKMDRRVDSLYQIMEQHKKQVDILTSRNEVLKEKKSLLDQNKQLGSEATGITVAELKSALEFYDEAHSRIKQEELRILNELEVVQLKISRLEHEIGLLEKKDIQPSYEVIIRVEAEQATKGEFRMSYLVANAGWFPKYDIRVESVDQPISLTYKADVFQNTGVDWENVKLRFSNADPNKSGTAPRLNTWYVNYLRNSITKNTSAAIHGSSAPQNIRMVSGIIRDESGEGLPGVNVVIKGTTVGTSTDLDGRYSISIPNGTDRFMISSVGMKTKEVPITSSMINVTMQPDVNQLQEVVVTGYASGVAGSAPGIRIRGNSSISRSKPVVTTVIENQTSVEFEVEMPYSIKSDGEKRSVELKVYAIDTEYEYYAAPKLDKDAFLVARITNWDQYNLLEGEANLYFEKAYVGRSVLDAKSLSDTLDISLGRDKNIVIGRQKKEDFLKRRTVGANKIESRAFDLLVRNQKNQNIKITLLDQIPVAAINTIGISPKNLSGGRLNELTGQVKWELIVPAKTQKELELAYEVKYPKRERVVLE